MAYNAKKTEHAGPKKGSGAFYGPKTDDASPITGSEMSKIPAELPRDPQVIALFKKIAGPDPLPAR